MVLQALLVGSALVEPTWITAVLPWDASPLNARFIAALYLMGAISAFLCMISRQYVEVRVSLIEIGFVTGTLLLITIPHFAEFTPANFPYRWVIFYTIDPLAVILILWLMRGKDKVPTGRNKFLSVFVGYAMILSVAAFMLFMLPQLAGNLWPWALPPILGQVYSVYFLTFAIGAILSAREPRWMGVWVYLAANLGMFGLIIGVSILHSSRFKPGLPTWVWYAIWLGVTVAFALVVLRRSSVLIPEEISA